MATSESAYTELWQTISEIRQKRQVFFSFPEKDLQRLLDYRKLRTEKYESIKTILKGSDDHLYHNHKEIFSRQYVHKLQDYNNLELYKTFDINLPYESNNEQEIYFNNEKDTYSTKNHSFYPSVHKNNLNQDIKTKRYLSPLIKSKVETSKSSSTSSTLEHIEMKKKKHIKKNENDYKGIINTPNKKVIQPSLLPLFVMAPLQSIHWVFPLEFTQTLNNMNILKKENEKYCLESLVDNIKQLSPIPHPH